MKAMRFFLILVVGLSVAMSAQAQKKGEKTVVYNATMHCGSCKAKVEKNIAFEKGVKDLKVNLDDQTITVTFREDKNSAEGIKKAIEKLEIPVKSMAEGQAKENVKGEKDKKACKKECEGEKK